MDELAERLSAALGDAYALGPVLGRGGMAAVYRATDLRLHREVAIKVLPPELGYSGEYRARFVREAQTAAGLSHPNIVPIFDVGDRAGLVWFVMALVEGETLAVRVERDGGVPPTVGRRVLQEVGQALAYAHARGVVHRDIKPDNILLDAGSGRAQVTDFGIAARLSPQSVVLTQPGTMLGTARYMAPEQLLGVAAVDGRADQYALALVGCFMLTGRHPIGGESLPAIIAEHVKGTAVDLAALRSRAPKPLVEALARCLRPNPEERFPRMEEFLESLRELGGELPEIAPAIRVFFRETERSIVLASMAAIALGMVGVGHLPPAFLILIAGGVVINWVKALEGARRGGIAWPQVRRALHIQRARRVEEVRHGSASHWGPLSTVMMVVMTGGLAVLAVEQDALFSSKPIDQVLYFGGLVGGLAAWRTLGLHRARRASRRAVSLRRWALNLLFVVLGAAAVLAALFIRRGNFSLERLVLAIATVSIFAAGGLAFIAVVRWRWGSAPPLAEPDWHVPGWLDLIGSLLFVGVERRRG